MNVETANRLMQYRKKAGLSQEELADKLGVSRQAVSKWECAESSPDTDNLIALAKIYNISLDELINGEAPKEEKKDGINLHFKDDEDEVHISASGIHLKDDEGNEVHIGNDGVEILNEKKEKIDTYFHRKGHYKLKTAESIISSLTVLGVIIAYLLLGFLVEGAWAHYWVLFLLIPLTPSILPAIYYRRFTIFAYPVLIVFLYLTLGVFISWWHPGWVLFLTIPVYYSVFGPIDHLISRKVRIADKILDAHDYDEDND